MAFRAFDTNTKTIRVSIKLLAVSIACANVSLAQSQELNSIGPADVLPFIFTPLDGNPRIFSAVTPNSNKDGLAPFFYPLEDLIEPATKTNIAATQPQKDTYAVELAIPQNVIPPENNIKQRSAETHTNSNNFHILENFALTSQLNFAVGHNNNIYTTATNEVSDQIATFRGNASLESKTRKNSIKFDAGLVAGRYVENTDDDYLDFNAAASYTSLLSLRSKVLLGINYSANHEERGAGSTDEITTASLTEPVQFDSTVARAIYEKGTNQTRTRFRANVSKNWLRTQNFEEIEVINRRDRDINTFVGTAFYNLSQRMSFLAELRHQDINYANNVPGDSFDSTQTRFAIGTEWLATKKTAGRFRIGIQDKDFDVEGNNDNQGISWDAIIEWTPLPRTEFVFETSSDITESEGFGVSRESMDYKVTWKQRWSPRLNSTASTQYSSTDYQQDPREDSISILNGEITYSLGTDTDASVKMTYIDNNSNLAEFSFDRAIIQLGLTIAL